MTYVMTSARNGRWGKPATIEHENDVVLLAAVNAGIATKLDEGEVACLEIVGWDQPASALEQEENA